MQTYTLNEETATKVLQQLIDEFGPDYRVGTAGCYYKNLDTNEPICIVGHLLVRTGFDISVLNEDTNASGFSNVLFRLTNLLQMEINIPDRLINALNEAQWVQDKGDTWGKAFEAFKTELNKP